MTALAATRPVRIAGGIVAYQEGPRLERAVASLLASELPPGASWSGLWIVASPGTDPTVAIARELARRDGRIHVVEETRRRGKAAALARLLAEMDGDLAVLLNGDAQVEADAVTCLLDAIPSLPGPFAVMARPIPRGTGGALRDRSIRLLWQLHHDLHDELVRAGRGTHLSDELLLVSLRDPPPLTEGIINDGAFIGSWLVRNGGCLGYAPGAHVIIDVPASARGLIEQRRRIHRGHRQVLRLTGVAPSTLDRRLVHDPREAFVIVRRSMRENRVGLGPLAFLAVCELLAIGLAAGDEVLRRAEPVAWTRVTPAGPPPAAPRAEHRGGE